MIYYGGTEHMGVGNRTHTLQGDTSGTYRVRGSFMDGADPQQQEGLGAFLSQARPPIPPSQPRRALGAEPGVTSAPVGGSGTGRGAEGDLGRSLGSCCSCCCCFLPQSTAGASNIWPVAMRLQHPVGIWDPVGGWDAGSPRYPTFPWLPLPFFFPPQQPWPAGAAPWHAGLGSGLSRPEQQVAQVSRDPPV